METIERLLAEHRFFEGMDESHLRLLSGCASNVRFNNGEMLFRQGEKANTFFLIRHGKVAIEINLQERGSLILQTAGEGEVVGWSWLIPPHRWIFDGRAVEMTRAVALDGECLRRKCDEDHDLGYELLKRFARVITGQLEAARLQLVNIHGPLD